MFTQITIKNVGNQKYDASEFAVFQMFILGQSIEEEKTRTAVIPRKIHVIDGFSAKTFIGIDVKKPENMIIDFANDILTIGTCQSFQVPIVPVTKGFRTNVSIYCTKNDDTG